MRLNTLLSGLILLISGCSIQYQSQEQPEVWKRGLNAPIAAGLVRSGNSIYCADTEGNLYSIWMDSGSTRWIKNPGGKILNLSAREDGIDVIVEENSSARLLNYDPVTGIIAGETGLPFIPIALVSGSAVELLYNSDSIAWFSPNGTVSSRPMPEALQGKLAAVVSGPSSFYLILDNLDLYQFNPESGNFRFLARGKAAFRGGASLVNGTLLVTTDRGVYSYSGEAGWNPIESLPTLASEKSVSPVVVWGDNGEESGFFGLTSDRKLWFNPSKKANLPMAVSESLQVVAALDSDGDLNILDSRSGDFINLAHIGSVETSSIRFASDYSGRALYVATSVPAQLVCLSLPILAKKKGK